MTRSAKRFFWLLCGFLALTLGIAGIPLPLLPTTPFLLLAAFCFSNGSEKLHNWLINHRVFGPPINDWNAHGVIPLRAKMLATLMMGAALLLSFMMHAPERAIWAQMVIMPLTCLFIWTRPSQPKKPTDIQQADISP